MEDSEIRKLISAWSQLPPTQLPRVLQMLLDSMEQPDLMRHQLLMHLEATDPASDEEEMGVECQCLECNSELDTQSCP
jgi:hypothetical protein